MASGTVDIRLLHGNRAKSVINIQLHKACVLGRELEHRTLHACLEAACNLVDRLDRNRVEECVVFFKVYRICLVTDDKCDCTDKRVFRSCFRSVCRNCNDGVLVSGDKAFTVLGDVCGCRQTVVSVSNRCSVNSFVRKACFRNCAISSISTGCSSWGSFPQ